MNPTQIRAPRSTTVRRLSSGLTIFLAIIGVLLVTLSANHVLTLLSLATLAFIWAGTMTSPFRMAIGGYLSIQWLQATMKVWIANVYGVDLGVQQSVVLTNSWQIFDVFPETYNAVLLALAAIAALALGIRLLAPRFRGFHFDVSNYSPSRLFLFYLAFLAVNQASGPFVGGGLAQPIIALGSLRFLFSILLLYHWIATRRGFLFLFAAASLDLIAGFTGFFSEFKNIILVLGFALVTSVPFYRARAVPMLVGACAAMLVLGTAWTVIKPAYRSILNEGVATQAVTIGLGERLVALGALFGELDPDDLADGFVKLARRIAYVDFLADVLERVPAFQPYEAGSLWREAVDQIVRPRLLFPNKPVLLSDSERTMRYTGRRLASDAEGTSFSIGYVGDSYIDFGLPGAIGIPFLLGLIYALVARHIVQLAPRRDLAFCIAILIVIFLPAYKFEVSNIKLFPTMLLRWIVFSLFVWGVWPWMRPLVSVTSEAPRSIRSDARFVGRG